MELNIRGPCNNRFKILEMEGQVAKEKQEKNINHRLLKFSSNSN